VKDTVKYISSHILSLSHFQAHVIWCAMVTIIQWRIVEGKDTPNASLLFFCLKM